MKVGTVIGGCLKYRLGSQRNKHGCGKKGCSDTRQVCVGISAYNYARSSLKECLINYYGIMGQNKPWGIDRLSEITIMTQT